MSTGVFSHARKLLQIWSQFFSDGQGSEGLWLIKESSYHSLFLRRGNIKTEMQPKINRWLDRVEDAVTSRHTGSMGPRQPHKAIKSSQNSAKSSRTLGNRLCPAPGGLPWNCH